MLHLYSIYILIRKCIDMRNVYTNSQHQLLQVTSYKNLNKHLSYFCKMSSVQIFKLTKIF